MRTAVPTNRRSVLVASLLTVFLTTCSNRSFAQDQRNHAEFERLAQKAAAEGMVNVIVHLNVQQINELTQASAGFSGVDEDRAVASERVEADVALAEAIQDAVRTVVAELARSNFVVNTTYRSIPFLALLVSSEALAVLDVSTVVLGVEEDLPLRLVEPVEDQRQDPDRPGGAGDDNGGWLDMPQLDISVPLVGARTAWSWGYTGAGWYVAILDTGIRRSHQFFSGKNIVEACFAKGSDGIAGAGDCPNGRSTMTGSGSAAPYSSSYSGYDHGTHVAGISTGNYGSLAGVAKDASIIALQVFSRFSAIDCELPQPCVLTWTSDSLAGLDYIYSVRGDYRIASVNMSLGGGKYSSSCDSDSRRAAIDNLRSVGIATTISSGNEALCNAVGSPACISSAVAVGASTDSDRAASFNNWHATLQKLFAPGSTINSSVSASDSSYSNKSGTSMAAPHVAGAWALMKQGIPSGSVTELLDALRTTGVSITSTCDANRTTIPRIRVDRAIASLLQYQLNLQSSEYGTTDPSPGVYRYPVGTEVRITAVPDTNADFVNWSGSATGTDNPLSVTMDSDKSITANFRFIYAPLATGRKVLNRTASQAEYINILSWQSNPANQGLSIAGYRIYRMDGGALSLLVDLGRDEVEYYHRKAGQGSAQYAVVAVTSTNREGAPALVTVQ